MTAIPLTIEASGFRPLSMVSILYIHRDLNRMFAGVFVKDNTEYFIISLRNRIVYFPFADTDLTLLLSDRSSLLAFFYRSIRKIQIIPKGNFGSVFLIKIWIDLVLGQWIRKPNAYYDWQAHLHTRIS
jgi:hypothetical protein